MCYNIDTMIDLRLFIVVGKLYSATFKLPKSDRNVAQQKFANYTMKSLRSIIVPTQLLVMSPDQIFCVHPADSLKNRVWTFSTEGKFTFSGQ